MSVWKLTASSCCRSPSTDEVEADRDRRGRCRVGRHDRRPRRDRRRGGRQRRLPAIPTARPTSARRSSSPTASASITSLGDDTAVLADPDGDLVVATPGTAGAARHRRARRRRQRLAGRRCSSPAPAADPSSRPRRTGASSPSRSAAATTEVAEIGQLAGTAPTAPIAFGGCVFAVSTAPATFSQWCGDGQGGWTEVQQAPLDGAGSELRLRLVNGWVWINDVDTGAAWVTSPQQRLDRVEDWGAILSRLDADDSDDNTDEQGGEVITEVNPDDPNAEIVQSDEIDEEGPNRPPIARDDTAQTRVDRPIDIDVLLNDTDPNGDVLVVASVEPTGGDGVVQIAPDGRSVQVSPAAGLRRHDHVRLHDHRRARRQRRRPASRCRSPRPTAAPTGRRRRTTTSPRPRRGRPTTFDVLGNDVDPDGDALVLDSIALKDPAAAAGQIVPDPSGQVVFTPDPNTTSERIELTYTVSDDFGATDEGTVIVSVRLEDANNEPDARNDAGVTVVGKPIRLDVLENDTDPDNDPLFVAQQPTLVRPTDRTTDSLDLSLTPDGELFFNPDTAGTYVFNYSATDGEETDVAQIRVEVGAAAENRPPIAIRDDVVIPAGGSRLVYVMNNDGDPDGDVIGLAGYDVDAGNGLTVQGGRRRRLPRHGRAGRAGPPDVPLPDLRRPLGPGVGRSSSWPSPTTSPSTSRPSPAPTSPRCAPAARSACRCWTTTTTPRAAPCRSSTSPRGRASTWRPASTARRVDVRVGRRRHLQLHAQLHGRRRRRQPLERVHRGAHRAARRGQPPADRPHRHLPHAERRRRRDRAAVANDSDPDGDIIAVESITHPADRAASPPSRTARSSTRRTTTFAGTDRLTYTLVDAGGEIAIGEVLIGVMPLSAENRAPEAFDDRVQAIAGSAPLVFDVLDNDSDPDGDRLRVTTVGTPTSGAAEVAEEGDGVVFTPPTAATTDGSAQEVAFTYAIDDGRGGTAQATVTVEVIAAGERAGARAVDDMVGPIAPGQTVDDRPARQRPRSRRQPGRARRHAATTPRSPTATAASSRSSPARRRAATPTRSPTRRPDRHRRGRRPRRAEPGPRRRSRTRCRPRRTRRSRSTSPPRPPTPTATRCSSPAATAPRAARRRRSPTAPAQLSVSFDPDDDFAGLGLVRLLRRRPAGPQRGRRVSRSRCSRRRTGRRSPTDTILTVEAGTPLTIDLAALVTDPDPNDTLTFSVDRAAVGRRGAGHRRLDRRRHGAARRRRHDRLVPVLRDRRGGSGATATVSLTVAPPARHRRRRRPTRRRRTRVRPVTVTVLGNDLDPLGRGLTVTSVGVSPAGSATTDGQHRHVHAGPRLLRPGVVHLPHPRRRQHRPARGRGAGRRHRHRPAVCTGHARSPARATRRRP